MQTSSQRFAAEILDATRRQLAELVAANTEITLAVVTSADGFEVAAHPDLPMAQRIAAMSSSLQALSEAIVREAGLSRSRSLIKRIHAANAREKSADRCVVLAGDGRGRYRLWKITRIA